MSTIDGFPAAFARLIDPRHPDEVRHSFSGLLVLTFLGPLGFTRR